MKLSVSLPAEDVHFLDSYSTREGLASRSEAVHRAVRLLRAAQLGPDYEYAWAEWDGSPDAEDWELSVADGLRPE
jgi:Arc/MetJ-type ribon-helix-helix transcriptional regulator